MNLFDELDLDKLEEALNSSITEPDSVPRAKQPELSEEKKTEIDYAKPQHVSRTDGAKGKRVKTRQYSCGIANDKAAKSCESNSDKKDGSTMSLYDWVQCVVYALVAGVLMFIFAGRAINIEGASMYPTLHNGDEVIVSDLFYSPKAGDVVVLRTLSYGPDPLVKRIIATEGQTVDIDFEAGVVYVDGTALEEDYVNAPIYFRDSFDEAVTVPEGCVFVLGDNRNESSDSRHESIGMVDERCIIGKVMCILLPAYEMDGERDWSRIGEVA